MRTTVDIHDDVLLAAKELARREKTSTGEALSRLARRGLLAAAGSPADERTHSAHSTESGFLGFEPFGDTTAVVTNATIDRIRDEEGA